MDNAWGIHYHGGETVGSVLERLERDVEQKTQALLELSEALQEAQSDLKDVGQAVEQAREIAEDARDAAGERPA